ncbi:MAG: hypothetical protein E7320_12480 [Clostridiales bacterium]|nr:hypothetical protein [Clostridiales bacterium]
MKRSLSLLLLFFMLFHPCAAAKAENTLTLTAGEVSGFSNNLITVEAPFAGSITLALQDERGTHRTWQAQVPAGVTQLQWDGLGPHREPLDRGAYTLTGFLTGEDGRCAAAEAAVTVGRCHNALLFALPTADILYLGKPSLWGCEMRIAASGGVIVAEICAADQPELVLHTQRNKIGSGVGITWRWDGKLGGKPAAPGQYLLRFWEKDAPAWVQEATVEVREGLPREEAVTVTGPIMPREGMTDQELWALMQQPSVVAALPAQTDHLELRAEKGKGARLGTVHGQTQGLEVQRIEGKYAYVGAWNHEDGSYTEGWVELKKLKAVHPRGDYGLLVDKAAQTLTVFHQGTRLGTVSISTGLAAENRLIRETAAGSFLTGSRISSFTDDQGLRYDYAIRYDGGNLIHQLGYEKVDGKKDFARHQVQLGTKASQGCIRVSDRPGEGGINAYWLYTHLPQGTRVIVLDDPEARCLQRFAAEGGEAPAGITPIAPPALTDGEREIVITLGGDVVLGTRESWWGREDALPAYLAAEGMDYPLRRLAPLFSADDMTFLNLECVLKADGEGEDREKLYRFRGLPEWTACLTGASVEQVSIANNHHIDYGSRGREATVAALEAAGIGYSGFERFHILEFDGWRIGFAGCRETVYLRDRNVVYRDIRALRQAGCHVVIYTCHWGQEYAPEHNMLQEQIAAAAAAAGADVVVGGHPHVVQGVDTVGSVPVLYSLGNLMFGGTIDMTTFDGMLAQLRLRFDGEGYRGCTVKLLPVLTSSRAGEGINDYCPVLAEGEDAGRILEKVQADTGFTVMEEMYFPGE